MFFLKKFIIKFIDKAKQEALIELEKQLTKINQDIKLHEKINKEKEKEISQKEKVIESLQVKIDFSENRIQELNQNQLTIAESITEIENKYNDLLNKEKIIEHLQQKINLSEARIQELHNNELTIGKKIAEIEARYEDVKDYGPEIPEAYGLYEPKYNLMNSILYKEKIDNNRVLQKKMISEKNAIVRTSEWLVNDSKREGNKLLNRVMKLALRAFNGECDAIIASIKYYSKYESRKQKIYKSYETINEMLDILSMQINDDFLKLKYCELDLVFEFEIKLQEEREALAKQREIERDEEIAKKEFEKEIKRLEKEQNHYQNEIEKMKEELTKAAVVEREKFEKKISDLMKKIEKLEEEKHNYQNLFENKAGYVYIISNIGSFGEEVFKIGTTRRLDPFERINELSNASVPFRFDSHAIMFSDNCYELERQLHQYFNFNRMNKVNNYKEFFRIPMGDLEEFIKRKDPTVKFAKVPEAIEFRTSLKILEKLKTEQLKNSDVS